MDIAKYEAVAKTCTEKSEYFASIGFQNLASSFKEAGEALTEMAELLRKVAEQPAEEGANE